MSGRQLDLLAGRGVVDAGLPRRLSAREGDAHYSRKAASLSDKVDVLLDGEILDVVTSWDVDVGRIERHVRDEAGRLVFDGVRPKFETAYGHVEVRWRREAAQ